MSYCILCAHPLVGNEDCPLCSNYKPKKGVPLTLKSNKVTHWEDCWREHHECAIAKIERLEKENVKLKDRLDHYQQIAQEAWFWSEE